MPELSFGEVGEILQLLQAVDGTEIDLEWGDLKIQVRRGGEASPVDSGSGTAQPGVADTQGGSGASASSAVEPVVSPPAVPAGPAATPNSGDAPTVSEEVAGRDIPAHWVAVTAPMAGTFYRAATPNDPPFAEVGDTVSEGQTVALIEVMKLFTELKSEVSGKVARVEVPDSTFVEYGQALVWIEPA